MILKESMRFWIVLAVLICTAYFVMQRQKHPQLAHNSMIDQLQHPLDTRLRYAIGEIDPRFNISPSQVQILAQQATDIWHQGSQQDLLIYDPAARLKINLIYDERQAESNARNAQSQIIENSRMYSNAEQNKVKQMDQQLQHVKQSLDFRYSNYQQRLLQFNQMVHQLNQSQQRMSESMAQHVQEQKQQLQQEQAQLSSEIQDFNNRVAQLNQQIDYSNQINQQFNHSVDAFNQHFQPRQFDKGVFNGQQINIYEFQSEADLKLTIAHELGHALGLKHNQDPKALMYPMMKEQDLQNFKLTSADLALLNSR